MSEFDQLDIVAPLFSHGKKKMFAGNPSNWVFDEMLGHPTAFRNQCRIYEAFSAGGQMVDVGANIGLTTIVAADFFREVVAFEPSQYNYGLLVHNLKLNGTKNVKTHRVALADSPGRSELHLGPDSNGVCHSLTQTIPAQIFGNTRSEPVEVRTLDSYEDQLQSCTFIQIDAEGNDMRVLNGARSLIANKLPLIQVEFAPHMWHEAGCGAIEFLQFVEQFGYDIYSDFGNNFCPVSRDVIHSLFGLWRNSHWGWLDLYLVQRGKGMGIFK